MTTELVFLRCLVLRFPELADQAFKFKKDAGESINKTDVFLGQYRFVWGRYPLTFPFYPEGVKCE